MPQSIPTRHNVQQSWSAWILVVRWLCLSTTSFPFFRDSENEENCFFPVFLKIRHFPTFTRICKNTHTNPISALFFILVLFAVWLFKIECGANCEALAWYKPQSKTFLIIACLLMYFRKVYHHENNWSYKKRR